MSHVLKSLMFKAGKVVYSGNKIMNMGKQPAFESSARFDFSDFSRPGRYVIKVGETKSVPFSVGNSYLCRSI